MHLWRIALTTYVPDANALQNNRVHTVTAPMESRKIAPIGAARLLSLIAGLTAAASLLSLFMEQRLGLWLIVFLYTGGVALPIAIIELWRARRPNCGLQGVLIGGIGCLAVWATGNGINVLVNERAEEWLSAAKAYAATRGSYPRTLGELHPDFLASPIPQREIFPGFRYFWRESLQHGELCLTHYRFPFRWVERCPLSKRVSEYLDDL